MVNPVTRLHSANMKLLLRELELGPSTTEDLQFVLKIHLTAVQKHLKVARDAGLVFIRHWERTQGDYRPVYSIRSNPKQRDQPRPPPRTNTEYDRRARANRKAGIVVKQQKDSKRWAKTGTTKSPSAST